MSDIIANRYQILEELGEGGMGVVYKVLDTSTNKIVALKLLFETSDKNSLLYFQREFKALSQLKHPNLVEVYDFGITDKGYYFTMEFVPGKNLFLATENINISKLYEIIVSICRALEYIHSKGIIHYDIKPSNIIVTGDDGQGTGEIKLMDFGLAGESTLIHTLESGSNKLSAETSARGTLAYISPEIIKGEQIDKRTDLYSLGVVLYQTLTRQLPYEDKSAYQLIRQHIEKTPIPIRELNPKVPEGLEKIVDKLLKKEPSERFNSANEIIIEINRFTGLSYPLETKETQISYILSGRFVGRDKELKRLKELISVESPTNKTFVALISGEAGIGKSRLIKEFKTFSQLNHIPFFIGTNSETKSTPYQSLIEILTSLTKYIKNIEPNLIDKYEKVLSSLLNFNKNEKTESSDELLSVKDKIKFISEIANFLQESAYILKTKNGVPFVIVFEDFHLTDELIAELCLYISRSTYNSESTSSKKERYKDSYPLICITYRPEEIPKDSYIEKTIKELSEEKSTEIIKIENLSFEDVINLIKSMLGIQHNPEDFGKVIFEETQGNPFFIEEIMKSLIDENIIYCENGEWTANVDDFKEIKIPKNIKEIVQKRINKIDDKSIRVLEIASVIGRNFDINILQQISGYKEELLFDILEQLVELKFLSKERKETNEIKYNFPYSKIQEIIYEKLSDTEKKKLHKLVGEYLERKYLGKDEYIDDLAYHFVKSDDRRKGAFYSLSAGNRSAHLYSNEHAIKHYTNAIKLTDEKDFVKLDMLYKRGNAYFTKGDYDKALDDYHNRLLLAKELNNKKEEGNAYLSLGDVSWKRGDFQKALEYYLSSVMIFNEIGEKKGTAQAFSGIGNIFIDKGDAKKAKEFFSKSLSIMQELNDDKGIANSLNSLGICYFRKYEYDNALKYFNDSIQIFRKIKNKPGEASCLLNIGNVFGSRGEYHTALEYYQKALDIENETGDLFGIIIASNNIALAYWRIENFHKATQYLKEALALSKKIGDKNSTAMALLNLGELHQDLGELKTALSYHKEALELIGKMGNKDLECDLLRNLGVDYYYLGNYSESLECFNKALKLAEKTDNKQYKLTIMLNLAGFYTSLDMHQSALSIIKPAMQLAKSIEDKFSLGYVLKAKARILMKEKAYGSARVILDLALEIAKELKNNSEIAQGYRMLGELYSEMKDHTKAMEFVKESLKFAREADNKLLKLRNYLQLSKIYFQIGLRSKALRYAHKSIDLAEQIETPEYLYRGHILLGDFYTEQRRTAGACYQYKQALQIAKKLEESIKDDEMKRAFEKAYKLKSLENDIKRKEIEHMHNKEFEGLGPISQAMEYIERARMTLQHWSEEGTTSDAQHKKMKMLLEMSKIINSTLNLDEVLSIAIDMVIEITGAERGFLMLKDENDELKVHVARNMDKETIESDDFKISRSIAYQALATQEPAFVTDTFKDDKLSSQASIMELGLRTIIAVPLKVARVTKENIVKNSVSEDEQKQEVIGIIYVDSHSVSEEFRWEDIEFLEAFASHTAISIENARLYKEALEKQKIEIENKLLKELDKKKTNLISVVAHEFKTPLTLIQGYSEKISKETEETDERLQKFSSTIFEQSKRLRRMVDDMLDLARISSGREKIEKTECNLVELIDNAILTVSPRAEEKKITITKDISTPNIIANVDRDKMMQVLINLLSNAVKYTLDGGKVNIKLEQLPDTNFKISVIDTGVGIPENDMDKLFEEFHRVDNPISKKERGTGLGLPITKSIVEAHGGRMEVKSKEGEGSTFAFIIPK